MANEVAYDALKARAVEIYANIQKTLRGADDPARNVTPEGVLLMLVHSHRNIGVEITFTQTKEVDIDLNFANGKRDLTRTQTMPHGAVF